MTTHRSALDQVREAIEEHGRPVWIAHVPFSIVKEVPYSELAPLLAVARASYAHDEKNQKVAAYESWLASNAGVEVTVDDVCDRLDISVGHARRFIADRPQYLWKARRGVWVARDPDADREAGA